MRGFRGVTTRLATRTDFAHATEDQAFIVRISWVTEDGTQVEAHHRARYQGPARSRGAWGLSMDRPRWAIRNPRFSFPIHVTAIERIDGRMRASGLGPRLPGGVFEVMADVLIHVDSLQIPVAGSTDSATLNT